ncbi:WcaI family glycosyltransferase [Croceicoccus sp. BE223]|uniref:WcaI family glycosyltransferase n=1 Tax=Croceicoccus sp. BE223 TaxID=2817716 RepID=UPI0028587099|nr:WcaI family glycosyltransferase [Croceicoccus sp. BE223]MDR7102053.1 colanic acid biosynthesis glycosyl transferase WcaI [Croceicoccus sp. BE223]
MRILIVGLNYAPEPVGIGPYTAGLAEGLASLGHVVEVVAGRPYYPQWQAADGFPARWHRRVERGVGVTRCPHYIPAMPSGMKRLVHLSSFSLAALFPAIRRARALRPDAVLVVAPSLLAVPVAWLSARLSGAMLWIHVQDFELEAAQATGLLAGDGLLARIGRWVERALLRSGDCVSTISPAMRARLAAKGVSPDRIFEMRNWSNHAPDSGTSPPDGGYRARWQLGEAKVALYSGNIANKQGLDIVIEAARQLADRRDIVFVICGEGPNRRLLEQQAARLANVQFHDLQPAERVGELLALAHCHLLPQLAGAADLVLPSKLTNMLRSGRPVVATAAAGTGLADEVEGCGLVTPPGDAAALASAIATLADDAPLADRLGDAGRRRARERWSQDAIIATAEGEVRRRAGIRAA